MADQSNLLYPFLQYARPRNPFSFEKIEETNRDTTSVIVTRDQWAQQLNLFGDTSRDAYIQGLAVTARAYTEEYLGTSLTPRTFNTYYAFLSGQQQYLYLDLPFVDGVTTTINSVSYYNTATPAALTTIPASSYQYDKTGNRVIVSVLPTDINAVFVNPIVVNFTTGVSPLATNPQVVQANLLYITSLYNNRSGESKENLSRTLACFHALLQPFKPIRM